MGGHADLDWLSLLTKLRATGMPVRDMQRYAELVLDITLTPDELAVLDSLATQVVGARY